MTDVSIIIPTFGDLAVWGPLADRAQSSAEAQTMPAEIVRVHGETLAQARNTGAARAAGEWLVHLDADDELDPGYVEAMLQGSAELRQPAMLGVLDGIEDDYPVLLPRRPLCDSNFLCIGTMVSKDLLARVGGFLGEPMLEDWSAWLRCWLEGATIESVPDAVYRVHVRPESRNSGERPEAIRIYNEIRQRYLPVARARGLV